MIRRTAAAFPLALLVACAAAPPAPPAVPAEWVVLVPGKDGAIGAVTVRQGAEQAVLDSAYATASVAAEGKVEVAYSDPAAVKAQFEAALKAQPDAPASYIVYFITGQDELTEESRKLVKPVLQEFARRPAPEVTVIGHADQTGTDQVNDPLSLQRAERVKEMLVSFGVPAARIVTAGRGSREPLVPATSGTAEPLNRRVEISVR